MKTENLPENWILNSVLLDSVIRTPDGGWCLSLSIPITHKKEIAALLTSNTSCFSCVLMPKVEEETKQELQEVQEYLEP